MTACTYVLQGPVRTKL